MVLIALPPPLPASPPLSLFTCNQVCSGLDKAALDPRVVGVCIEVGLLQAGWAKVAEVRRHLAAFRQSGECVACEGGRY